MRRFYKVRRLKKVVKKNKDWILSYVFLLASFGVLVRIKYGVG